MFLNPLTIQFLDGVFLRVVDYVVVIFLGSVPPYVGWLVFVGTIGSLTLPVVIHLEIPRMNIKIIQIFRLLYWERWCSSVTFDILDYLGLGWRNAREGARRLVYQNFY